MALPSSQSLHQLSSGFLFNCGAFFGLSLGLFAGIVISIIVMVTQHIYKRGRWAVLSIIGIWLCMVAGMDLYPLISLLLFISLPFVVHAGYSLPSYLLNRRTPRAGKGENAHCAVMPVKRAGWIIYGISFVILVSLASLFSSYATDSPLDYIRIRDEFLITNRMGNYINSFYYTHSPFAAETIKPLKNKRQLTILSIGKDERTIRALKKYRKKRGGFLNTAGSREEAEKYLSGGGIDIIIIDGINEEMADYPADRYDDIKEYAIVLTTSGDKKISMNGYTPVSMTKPVTVKKIKGAIGRLSDLSDRADGIRYLLKLALFDYAWLIALTSAYLVILSVVTIAVSCLKTLITLIIIVPTVAYLLLNGAWDHEKIRHNTPSASLEALNHRNPVVRMYAVEALGELKSSEAVPMLIHLLNDPQINVRYKSAEALGKTGDTLALQPLVTLIQENRVWYVSDYALVALRRLKSKE